MKPKLFFRLLFCAIMATLFLPARAKGWWESEGSNRRNYYYECDTVIDGIAYRMDEANLKASVTYFSQKVHETARLIDDTMGIGFYAFDYDYEHNYGNLRYSGNVVIPEQVEFGGRTYSVTSIDTHAFDGCKEITDIQIPKSVYYNFPYWSGDTKENGEYSISSFTLGRLYITYGEGLEYNQIYFKDPFPWLLDQPAGTAIYQGDGVATIVTQKWYETDSKRDGRATVKVDDVQIKEGTKSIMSRAAYNLSASRIVTPASLERIDSRAFEQAQVDDIVMENVKVIGDFAFEQAQVDDIVMENVKVIGDFAFEGAQMKSISMPNVEQIGGAAFRNSGLREFSNTPLLKSIGPSAFWGCTALTSVTIPPLLTSISNGAFSGCTALTSITIPNTVTSVGYSAFSSCTALKTVILLNTSLKFSNYTFPNLNNLIMPVSITDFGQYQNMSVSNLTLIGRGSWNMASLADFSLSKLKTITLGSGVTSLGDCGLNVEAVNCYATTPPVCTAGTFKNYTGELHVPTDAVGAYFTAPVWQKFGNLKNDLSKVAISQAEAHMLKGDELLLTATTVPQAAELMWWSSNPAVAIVDADGKVTATGPGECDIYASPADNLAAYAWCHVDAHVPAVITLPAEAIAARLNTIVTLAPGFDPEPTDIVASSSDPSVVLVRIADAPANGAASAPVTGPTNLQVLGLKEGTATVTVASVDGLSVPATLAVTIVDHFPEGDVNCDRTVNGADVTALYNALMGSDEVGPAGMPAIYTTNLDGTPVLDGDVNGDGVVSGADITALYNLLLQ